MELNWLKLDQLYWLQPCTVTRYSPQLSTKLLRQWKTHYCNMSFYISLLEEQRQTRHFGSYFSWAILYKILRSNSTIVQLEDKSESLEQLGVGWTIVSWKAACINDDYAVRWTDKQEICKLGLGLSRMWSDHHLISVYKHHHTLIGDVANVISDSNSWTTGSTEAAQI